MPFWSLVLITIGGQAIGMRSMAIYELNADYVKYSRFMGIKAVSYTHLNSVSASSSCPRASKISARTNSDSCLLYTSRCV